MKFVGVMQLAMSQKFGIFAKFPNLCKANTWYNSETFTVIIDPEVGEKFSF